MKNNRIRKITIAKGYYSETNVMNYVVGGDAYGGYTIVSIDEDDDGSISIYIKNKNKELIEWKRFSQTVAISIEYSMDYDNEIDV